jgi:ABC-2 type transport system ATP-binding protein
MIANRMVIINLGKKIVEAEVHNLIEEHQYTTTFFVDNPDHGRTQLIRKGFQPEEAVVSGKTLKVQCQKKDIPEINALLVENGIRVESIRMDQTLEDYFLTQMQ